LVIVPVKKSFFVEPTLELAKKLLGCLLVNIDNEEITAGYIVETEAYLGPRDEAAHSYKNRRTKRTEILFGEAGYCYAHAIHTHTLINVTSGEINQPEGVLIRALEPYTGIELMKSRRGIDNINQLTNGPGKLTKALNITMDAYGLPFFKKPLFISETGYKPEKVLTGGRIGISKAQERPWRFWIADNTFISTKQKK
jgi:DNA-3-methyladenine glycosylase